MRFSCLQIILGAASTAVASYQGFNYAAQGNNLESFHKQFSLATSLPGTANFSSARLYTMIQEGTNDSVIEAISAALATNTKLLLGLWASVDAESFAKELRALDSAMKLYGSQLRDLVIGISVGSEDLYRSSVLGRSQSISTGQDVTVLLDYIQQVRQLLVGSVLEHVPVGHVDTLDAYTNTTNSVIIDAVDFMGVNIFPYFSNDQTMNVSDAARSFWAAYESTLQIAQGKSVWITETGWPWLDPSKTSGPQPSVENAAVYWSEVACELQARSIGFWWYILSDPADMPYFGVTDSRSDEPGSALYGLECGAKAARSSIEILTLASMSSRTIERQPTWTNTNFVPTHTCFD
ncbi:glycoside hydrolase, partial [Aureobasidium melanogenum]